MSLPRRFPIPLIIQPRIIIQDTLVLTITPNRKVVLSYFVIRTVEFINRPI